MIIGNNRNNNNIGYTCDVTFIFLATVLPPPTTYLITYCYSNINKIKQKTTFINK